VSNSPKNLKRVSWLKVHGALLTVALIYGSNYSIAKVAMNALPPFALVFVRIVVAGSLFWVLHQFTLREKIQSKKDFGLLAICGLFGVAINQIMFLYGLDLTTSINSSVIMTTTPILVLIISSILIGEKITLQKGIGVVLGGLGAIMLIGGLDFEFSSSNAKGDLFILINAISYGLYLVFVKPLMKKYQTLTVVKWIFLFGFLIAFPFTWQDFASVSWSELNWEAWASLSFVVLGATFSVYILNGWALQYVNPSVVGVYIYIQPVLATLIALYFGQGELTLTKVGFAGLIFIGVFLVIRKKK
jgi:drug/metabolite transporter (DMT)-like permease